MSIEFIEQIKEIYLRKLLFERIDFEFE